jgi:hypothetical protein
VVPAEFLMYFKGYSIDSIYCRVERGHELKCRCYLHNHVSNPSHLGEERHSPHCVVLEVC